MRTVGRRDGLVRGGGLGPRRGRKGGRGRRGDGPVRPVGDGRGTSQAAGIKGVAKGWDERDRRRDGTGEERTGNTHRAEGVVL